MKSLIYFAKTTLKYVLILLGIILSIIGIYFILFFKPNSKMGIIGEYYDVGIVVDKQDYIYKQTPSIPLVSGNVSHKRTYKVYIWDKETNQVIVKTDKELYDSVDKDDRLIINRIISRDEIINKIIREQHEIISIKKDE